MKYIFLDIDGVLNNENTTDLNPSGQVGVSMKQVRNLAGIVTATGAKIILTSDWKYGWSQSVSDFDDELRKYFVHTDSQKGLTADDTHSAIEVLQGSMLPDCVGETITADKAEEIPKRGVFWVIENNELLAFPFEEGTDIGLSKSGDNYSHKLLWEHIKPKHCNKPFDYYPRGRVEFSNKGKPIIYMNKNVGEEMICPIMEAFDLTETPIIHYDGSKHYKCCLDR